MKRIHAQSLFAVAVVLFIWVGTLLVGAFAAGPIFKYDGPILFAVGMFVAGLIAERILFRTKKPPPETRGFPIEPIEHQFERTSK